MALSRVGRIGSMRLTPCDGPVASKHALYVGLVSHVSRNVIVALWQRRLVIGAALIASGVEARAQTSRSASGNELPRVVALQVIDDATDTPLPGVRVSILGDSTERFTDTRGRAVLVAQRSGRLPIVLRRLGYLPGSVMADLSVTDTTRLTFAMSQVAQTLTTVAVNEKAVTKSAILTGFERRRLAGSGSARFISRDDIDRRHPLRTTDVLQGISSIFLMIEGQKTIPMNRRGVSMGMGCAYQVGIDGHLMESGFDINSIEPGEVYGVEVFPGPATVPMEFRSTRRSSGCGLIMVWTRRSM